MGQGPPRSWDGVVAGCIPAVTGCWEQGPWGDRKDSWGFLSFHDPQMEENCASSVVQVLQGWVNRGQGSPWDQLCLCPLAPGQGHMNLSHWRRVPDCHLPCDESRLPRNPLCS